jgi:hypothetical protein
MFLEVLNDKKKIQNVYMRVGVGRNRVRERGSQGRREEPGKGRAAMKRISVT